MCDFGPAARFRINEFKHTRECVAIKMRMKQRALRAEKFIKA